MHCCDKNDIRAAVVLILLHVETDTIASVIEKKTKLKVGKIEGMEGLPSETMKKGETPEQTAYRLMWEELGLDWGEDIDILPDLLEDLPHEYDVHVAVARIYGSEKPAINPNDVTQVAFNRWLRIKDFFRLKWMTCGTRPETEPALIKFSHI